jgi:hypothetical protein
MTSLLVTSLSVTSHPVTMLLSVMSNGTFCTTTIVRKKAGMHFRACAEHTSGNDVSSKHSSEGAKGSGPLRMRYWKWRHRKRPWPEWSHVTGSDVITGSMFCACPEVQPAPLCSLWTMLWAIPIYYFDIWIWVGGGQPINNPWKIYQGRQSPCPFLAKLKVLPGSLTDISA